MSNGEKIACQPILKKGCKATAEFGDSQRGDGSRPESARDNLMFVGPLHIVFGTRRVERSCRIVKNHVAKKSRFSFQGSRW